VARRLRPRAAAKLAKVTERLAADAPNLERPGADLIAWCQCPDWHPVGRIESDGYYV